jgi:hypothetical protein
MILVFLHQQEADDLIDSTLGIPTVPSLGQILVPVNPGPVFVLDVLFDDQAMISDVFDLVLRNQYLNDRSPARTCDEFALAQLFNMRDKDFKQAVRTTKLGFIDGHHCLTPEGPIVRLYVYHKRMFDTYPKGDVESRPEGARWCFQQRMYGGLSFIWKI